MGFRKQKPNIDARHQWRNFVAKHSALIHELALPSIIVESEDHWRDFLHHGKLEIAEDRTSYRYPKPHHPGYRAFVQLIELYFEMQGPCVELWPGLLSSTE